MVGQGNNPRIHPREQQEGMCGVLDTLGWIEEVTVNQRTGYVVDGHMRIKLALCFWDHVIGTGYVSHVLSQGSPRCLLNTST